MLLLNPGVLDKVSMRGVFSGRKGCVVVREIFHERQVLTRAKEYGYIQGSSFEKAAAGLRSRLNRHTLEPCAQCSVKLEMLKEVFISYAEDIRSLYQDVLLKELRV